MLRRAVPPELFDRDASDRLPGDGHPDPPVRGDDALWALADVDRLADLVCLGVDAADGAVAAVRDPDRARADGDPGRSLPTGIVVVTARVLGSMRTTVSSLLLATQTPPAPSAIADGLPPTVIGVSNPVGSTRVTVPASLSATQRRLVRRRPLSDLHSDRSRRRRGRSAGPVA